MTCTPTVNGIGDYNSAVNWTSSNTAFATVDATGKVTALAVGTATITATSVQPSPVVAGTASVTVAAPPTITSVSVSCTPSPVTDDETAQCTASVQGTGNLDPSVIWSASAGSIAGGVYTPPPLTSYTVETITATSNQDSTKSGSLALPVQRARPTGTWTPSGPQGGNIVVLAQDPSHPNVVYAGESIGNVGGVWKSTDGGVTWTALETGTEMDTEPLADIDVLDGGETIVAAGDYFTFKSTDGGNTWSEVTLPVTSAQVGVSLVGALAVTPQNNSVIYLSGRNYGVMKSQDKGSTWTLLPGSPTTGQILHNALLVDSNNASVVYYGTDHGLFISRDSGQTWTRSATGFAATDTSIRDLAADPANTSEILALAGAPTSAVVTLYQSVDGGNTWTAPGSGAGLDGERVVPDPGNANIVYLYGLQCHAVYRSTDAGAIFSPSDNGMPGSGSPAGNCSGGPLEVFGPTGSMIILSTPPESYLATVGGSGVWKSSDGQNWTLSTQGISAYFGCAMAIDPENPQTVFFGACNGGGTWKSTDGGTTWTPVFSDTTSIAVDPFDSTHVLAHGSPGLFESHDGGMTWTQVTNLPPPPSGTSALIQDIAFHPSQAGVIFVTTQLGGVAVVRSTDGGTSWEIVNSGLQNNNASWDQAYSPVVVSPTDPNTIFVGMADGLYMSTDMGNSWQLVGFQNEQVNGLAIDANAQPVSLYASPYGGVVSKSNDLGSTWTNLNVSGSVVVDPSSANSLFLICAFGGGCGAITASWSPDAGQTWLPISEGLGKTLIGYNGWGRGYAVARTSPQVLYATSVSRSIMRYVTGP